MSTSGPIKFTIEPARSVTDLEATRSLFTTYATSLGLDLSFQAFDAEMASMPGKYAPPTGEILLAHDERGAVIGCVAVRPQPQDGCCEIKRLYVSPEGRGLGLGTAWSRQSWTPRDGWDTVTSDWIPCLPWSAPLHRIGRLASSPSRLIMRTLSASCSFLAEHCDDESGGHQKGPQPGARASDRVEGDRRGACEHARDRFGRGGPKVEQAPSADVVDAGQQRQMTRGIYEACPTLHSVLTQFLHVQSRHYCCGWVVAQSRNSCSWRVFRGSRLKSPSPP